MLLMTTYYIIVLKHKAYFLLLWSYEFLFANIKSHLWHFLFEATKIGCDTNMKPQKHVNQPVICRVKERQVEKKKRKRSRDREWDTGRAEINCDKRPLSKWEFLSR